MLGWGKLKGFTLQFLKDFSLPILFNNYRYNYKLLSKVKIEDINLLSHQYFDQLRGLYLENLSRNEQARLISSADKVRTLPYLSVLDKHPGLDRREPRDYVSFAPYYWLNEVVSPIERARIKPTKRDGEANPFLAVRSDKPKLAQVCSRVHLLALAYTKTKNSKYLKYIEEQLEVWFIDENSRMSTHMKHAQILPWSGRKSGLGVIDARWLVLLIDALALLKVEKAANVDTIRKVCKWLLCFSTWLTTSMSGLTELARKNNRGSWIDTLLCYIALAVNEPEIAKEVSTFSLNERLSKQVSKDGMQPFELIRKMPISYSLYNIFPVLYLAQINVCLCKEMNNNEHVDALRNSMSELYQLIEGREKGCIESIDFDYTFDLNLYYPYSFAQIKSFPAVMPFAN